MQELFNETAAFGELDNASESSSSGDAIDLQEEYDEQVQVM
ncbi:MAG: hypothetical protein ACI8WP_001694 [Flavobacteriaceae bacterium]|jgi:hypothetical protein